MFPAGRLNALADVGGLHIGHVDRRDGGYLTGTTVVLAPQGMVAGVDVRGGSPGTRETDLLDPTAAIQRVHAIVLTGGSAFGLSAASGVADALAAAGIGLPVGGDPGEVVPIVPAAVLFDLGRGGSFRSRPDPTFGERAVAAALSGGADDRIGLIGAGTGAVSSGIKSGLGTASSVLADGSTVAAVVVANAVGSPVDPRNGELFGARNLLPADFPALRVPSTAHRNALQAVVSATGPHLRTPGAAMSNTCIGIVATDAALTKVQCAKMAGTAHDGLARALNPVHTQFDGDTLFAVSTALRPAPDDIALHGILCAAADVVTRALVRGLLAAESVQTPGGSWSSYLDLAPSARGE